MADTPDPESNNAPDQRHRWPGLANAAGAALGAATGVVVLWVFLLYGVSLGLTLLSPSPSYYTLSYFMTIATALTIPISTVAGLGYLWVRQVPDSRLAVRGREDDAISPIIKDFRIRSGLYRLAAGALFVLLAAVTVIGFFLISTPGRDRTNYHEALPGELPALMEPLIATREETEALAEPEVLQLLVTILNRSAYPTWGEVAGAAALWVVLVQVIASLFRRMVRLASFYDSRADFLQLRGTVDTVDWHKVLEMVDPGRMSSEGWIRNLMRMRRGSS